MKSTPEIIKSGWGKITVNLSDGDKTFRDIKLYPGGARAWDWNETGTHHNPGIQPVDVKEIVENGAEYILLSRGRNLRLQVMDETKEWLQAHNAEFEILPTDEVIEKCNELRQEKLTGALIHTTC